jgi:hypothetical protein
MKIFGIEWSLRYISYETKSQNSERIENKPNKINVSKIALGWLMTLFAAGLMTILFIYVMPA